MGQITGLFSAIFGRRERVPVRHIIATKSESAKVRAAREKTTAALRRYVNERKLVEAVAQAVNVDPRVAYRGGRG